MFVRYDSPRMYLEAALVAISWSREVLLLPIGIQEGQRSGEGTSLVGCGGEVGDLSTKVLIVESIIEVRSREALSVSL